MKKTLALLIAALFVLSVFVACTPQETPPDPAKTSEETKAQNQTEVQTVEPAETDSADYQIDEEIAARKTEFKDYTLTILASNYTNDWPADDLFREEDSDEALDSAIYNRNLNVKEKYGFDIQQSVPSKPGENTPQSISHIISKNTKEKSVVTRTTHGINPAADKQVEVDD